MRRLAPSLCALVFLAVLCADATAQATPDIADLSLEELGAVRVSGVSRVDESPEAAPASVTIFGPREFERFGWATAADAIDAAPGMLTVSSAFVNRAPAIRGDLRATGGLHVLVLLNGRPLRGSLDALSSQDLLVQIPLAGIERIELIRGPGSVLYGTNAFAGVINVVTRDREGRHAAVSGTLGSLDSRSATALAGLTTGKIRLSATGRFADHPELRRTFSDEAGESHRISLPAREAVLITSLRTGALGLDALYTHRNAPTLAPFLPGIPREPFRADGWYLNGSLEGVIASGVTGRGDVGYSRTRARSSGDVNTRTSADDILLEGTLFIRPAPRLRVLTGGTANRLSGNATYLGRQALDYDQWVGSAYLQGEFSPDPAWRLVAGGQAIEASHEAVQVVPRAAAIYQGTSGLGLKLLYGEAYRSPSPAETDIQRPPILTGNPDLRPERVRTAEAVFSIRKARGNVAVSLFLSRQRDLVATVPGAGGTTTYRNQGVFLARGGELEGSFQPSPRWLFLGSLSYQANRLDDSLSDVGRSPAWLARAGVSWSRPALALSLFDNWVGASPPASRLFPGIPAVNPRARAYHLVTARARVRLGGTSPHRLSLTAHLQIDNLFDEETWYPDATFARVNTLPWRPGRTITVGLAADWRSR
ncbi:MAG TPA: TonB-dependent receptor [Gemmatimonadales bacterium]|nr:TonB-dependent receptor [Gemmatimonadales bacterium]